MQHTNRYKKNKKIPPISTITKRYDGAAGKKINRTIKTGL